jgi:hypothetical protein
VNQTHLFYSAFAAWAGSAGAPAASRARLLAALRKSIEVELPRRDQDFEVVVRDLTQTEDLTCRIELENISVFPAHDDCLAVGVCCPDWSRGWARISRDAVVVDHVSTFFFQARQYVLRSRQASVLGAIFLTYKRACDFRGSWLESRRASRTEVEPVAVLNTIVTKRERSITSRRKAGRTRTLLQWVHSINALDPFVHRGIFQLVRAKNLLDGNFYEEFVTALDGLTSVSSQFAAQRLGFGALRGKDLAAALGLPEGDGAVLQHIYDLRCAFGAHPGESNWWDFSEIYEDWFPKFLDAAERTLVKLIALEQLHRTVDPDPSLWSQWFTENALHVYDAVWSHKLPPPA